MGLINVLDISVANLIAAGEVVERPSSAVKELIENSVDAGAKNITVEIKKGGISLLRVTDDGCGMSADDAVLSVKRHATSKIRTAADLSAIMTLGFRGEALAAISAVTKFRILTKRRDDNVGTSLTSIYGGAPKVEEAGCPDGTTVICEELFATTPARLKFLKSDASEAAAVQGVVERAAVSHPEIAMRYISDGAMKFSTSGDGDLDSAIYSVYGRAFASSLVPVKSDGGGIKVSGYVSSPEFTRGNRGMQIFYVNGRSVRSKLLQAALEQAFDTYIPIGKFPSCVLDVMIHSAYVDVNIHPSKLEVKFSDERSVFSAVYYAVRSALESNIARPLLDKNAERAREEREKIKITSAFTPVRERGEHTAEQIKITDAVPKSEASAPKTEQENIFIHSNNSIYSSVAPKSQMLHAESGFSSYEMRAPKRVDVSVECDTDAKIPDKSAKEIPEYRIAGEVFDTYVIIELEDRMILVDKHAAHERINFEILRAQMKELTPNVQLLIAPERVPLSSDEAETCRSYKTELESVGFVFEIEEKAAKISGVPIGYDVKSGCELFSEMLSSLIDEGVPPEIKKRSVFEHALYQTSCKMSIKAGRHYGEEHLKWICDNLLRYDCIKFCPHGRPVAFEMTKRELDTRFGRIK
ncbi:MAG: DNA mismatch repair endonuclease MutL [Clostridia bacterium]|nr:DNA mismatch repair endonuclease MutL [Clostridia bacterium]